MLFRSPKHPDYTPPTAHSTEAQRTAKELVSPITGPSTLNLELLITPRRHPQPLDSSEVTEGTSPLVGIPQTPHSDKSLSSVEEEGSSEETDSPEGPPLVQQEEDILAAQVQYGLDIEERELENPLTPDQPVYQQLIEIAVIAGVNIPSPPPLTLQIQAPILPQQAIPQAPMAQAAQATDPKIRGDPPNYFTGD